MKKLPFILLTFLAMSGTSRAQEVIEEAKISFTLPDQWSLAQKAGTFDDGLVQYFYSREPVLTSEGNEAYPATIFILDEVNGRILEDFVKADMQYERNGRMSAGTFGEIQEVDLNGISARSFEVKIEDSGYRLRTQFFYFFENNVAIKLVLNTIQDPNPAIEELQAIVNSIQRQ